VASRLGDAGIGYVHLPRLGKPRDNRDAFRRGESSARALEHIGDLAEQHPVALMCFERNPSECHRVMVADALVELNPTLHVSRLQS
jgi:uncharacterized protein (DUF488 family)